MATLLLTFVLAQAPLEQRVEKLEKAMTDAGRALLFRNPVMQAPATYPKPMAGPGPTVVVRPPAVRMTLRTEGPRVWRPFFRR